MGLGILTAVVVSLLQFPPYYRAAVSVQHAEAVAAQGQDRNAVEFFLNEVRLVPGSKRARIGLAISYFRSPDDVDHQRALEVL